MGRGVETARGRVTAFVKDEGPAKMELALCQTGSGLCGSVGAKMVIVVVGVIIGAIVDVKGMQSSVREPPPPILGVTSWPIAFDAAVFRGPVGITLRHGTRDRGRSPRGAGGDGVGDVARTVGFGEVAVNACWG